MIKPEIKIQINQLKLAKFLRDFKGSMNSVHVGYNEESGKYNNGKNVVEVAQINEFGFGNHPPRPFMSTTLNDNHYKYEDYLKSNFNKLDANALGQGIDNLLLDIGNVVKEDMKYTIDLMNIEDPRPNENGEVKIDKDRMKDGIQVELEKK